MAKRPKVLWLARPESHDFAAALDYLTLIMDPGQAAALCLEMEAHAGDLAERKAKDILRASGLPLLPGASVHVAKDLAKVKVGVPLSPVLLVRGHMNRPLVIADGYHRVCACEIYDENTPIPAVLV